MAWWGMTFTGKLGTPDSKLGNIKLGAVPALSPLVVIAAIIHHLRQQGIS
jgi:hypothetical protein